MIRLHIAFGTSLVLFFPAFCTQSQQDPSKITVSICITGTDTKYHTADCRYGQQSKIAISLPDAKGTGLYPGYRALTLVKRGDIDYVNWAGVFLLAASSADSFDFSLVVTLSNPIALLNRVEA